MVGRYAAMISLGCAKNLVDSELMVSQMIDLGYEMTSEAGEASLIVVNTCGFLQSAVEESVQTVLDLARNKTNGSCEKLVVAGCMVQRYGKKLLDLLPEVDLFIGTSHFHEMKDILRRSEAGSKKRLWIAFPDHLETGPLSSARQTTDSFAYVKIAEGCSNRCSFCLIPRLRGPYRSRTTEDVFQEIGHLVSGGVKEINLIAQDTTAFGSDRNDSSALVRLIESLEGIDGLEWVRVLYAYPDRITNELLRAMAQSSKIVPYLDVPLQHCVPRVLRDMHRKGEAPEDIVGRIRKMIPGVAVRTSLIVGFPGETGEEFRELVEFVERVQFEHLGIFAFSPEPGSRAARLPGRIDSEVATERRRTLLEIQRTISRRHLERLIDRILPVLVEGIHPETDLLLSGRLAIQAPEVDGSVLITGGTGVAGEIMPCRITGTHDYDVEAVLVTS